MGDRRIYIPPGILSDVEETIIEIPPEYADEENLIAWNCSDLGEVLEETEETIEEIDDGSDTSDTSDTICALCARSSELEVQADRTFTVEATPDDADARSPVKSKRDPPPAQRRSSVEQGACPPAEPKSRPKAPAGRKPSSGGEDLNKSVIDRADMSCRGSETTNVADLLGKTLQEAVSELEQAEGEHVTTVLKSFQQLRRELTEQQLPPPPPEENDDGFSRKSQRLIIPKGLVDPNNVTIVSLPRTCTRGTVIVGPSQIQTSPTGFDNIPAGYNQNSLVPPPPQSFAYPPSAFPYSSPAGYGPQQVPPMQPPMGCATPQASSGPLPACCTAPPQVTSGSSYMNGAPSGSCSGPSPSCGSKPGSSMLPASCSQSQGPNNSMEYSFERDFCPRYTSAKINPKDQNSVHNISRGFSKPIARSELPEYDINKLRRRRQQKCIELESSSDSDTFSDKFITCCSSGDNIWKTCLDEEQIPEQIPSPRTKRHHHHQRPTYDRSPCYPPAHDKPRPRFQTENMESRLDHTGRSSRGCKNNQTSVENTEDVEWEAIRRDLEAFQKARRKLLNSTSALAKSGIEPSGHRSDTSHTSDPDTDKCGCGGTSLKNNTSSKSISGRPPMSKQRDQEKKGTVRPDKEMDDIKNDNSKKENKKRAAQEKKEKEKERRARKKAERSKGVRKYKFIWQDD